MSARAFCSSVALLLCACGNSAPADPPSLKAMTPASHDALFPIGTGTHAGIDCDVCHGAFDSFSQFNCVNCHSHEKPKVDPFHLGIVAAKGYAWGPQTCYACHPRGEAAGFDHTPRFPIAAGAVHQNLLCSVCHTDPSSRKIFDCTSCHPQAKTASLASDMTARHSVVTGYQWASPSCYGCHPDAKVPLNAGIDHELKFPIAAGTRHAGVSCGTCHVDPSNRKILSCTSAGCHPAPSITQSHAGVANFSSASASCYACHPQSNPVGLGFAHTFFPIAATDKHKNLSCATCHPTPGNRKIFSCSGGACHPAAAVDPTHTAVPNYAFSATSCLGCHPQSTVVSAVDHTKYFPIAATDRHKGLACASCHLTPTTQSCAGSCHLTALMSTRHAQVGGYSFSSALCLRCHADSQIKRNAVHLPFRIVSPAKHANKACLKCHPASRVDKPFGADFRVSLISCLGTGCHGNPHHRTGNNFTTCLAANCHPDGSK